MNLTIKDRKSVLRILKVLLPVSFVILCIVPSWNNMKTGNSLASNKADEIINKDNEQVQILVNPVNTFDYEGTEFLKKNDIEEINELINNYYAATLNLDLDELEWYVSDIDQVDYYRLQAQLEYMEGIDNIICYTVEGDSEETYRVYVYYDMKIRGIETPAPALSALYVTMSSDGEYIVYLSELDSETQDFIIETDNSEDVMILKALVDERFNSVVESDEKLADFCKMLEGNNSEQDATNAGDAVTGSAIQ